MSANADLAVPEREAIKQYADWYSSRGYRVSIEPPIGELPDFLRTLAPDLIARRGDETIVVEIKTSSPASDEQVRRLARALEHRAGWKLQVVFVDLPDPEWTPPARLPETADLLARLNGFDVANEGNNDRGAQFLLLWSIFEAAARRKLSTAEVSPTRRISSSALLKTLLTEGFIEEAEYLKLRDGLAIRNAIAHGFLNQSVSSGVFRKVRQAARQLLKGSARLSANG